MHSYKRRFLLLSIIGSLVSAYLLYHYTWANSGYHTGTSICSFGKSLDCDAVARSPFSRIFGIPVAGYGLFFYLMLTFILTCLTSRDEPAADKRFGPLMLAIATMAVVPTILLFLISTLFLGTYCIFCCILYVNSALLFALALYSPYRHGSFSADFLAGIRYWFGIFFARSDRSTAGAKLPKKSFSGPVAAWCAAAIFGTAVYNAPWMIEEYYLMPAVNQKTLQPIVDAWRAGPILNIPIYEGTPAERDFVQGSKDALVTIIGFSDFECPHCKHTALALKPFLAANRDKVRFVFKNYPLDNTCNERLERRGHQFACRAAQMGRCAGEQSDDLFWKMHDTIFGLDTIDETNLSELPKKLGVDEPKFAACMKGSESLDRIKLDIKAGSEAGLQGTPFIVVNGKFLPLSPDLLPTVISMIVVEEKKAQR